MGTAGIDNAQRYGRVAVLMGGRSAEREISLQSGTAVLKALQEAGIDARALDAAAGNLPEELSGGGFDRVFIALHGRGGEDGVMQGLLEVLGLPYTGSGVLGSALAMDKLRTKQVWDSAGIPTPPFVILRTGEDLETVGKLLDYPVIIKPAREGSSIGISKVESPGGLHAAWREALGHDDLVLAEQWIEGGEYTAGILDDAVLPLIRLETPNTFYDYAAKYQADTTRYLIPCGLEEAQETALRAHALDAFRATAASGWGRVDFLLDANARPWFIEVNTVPGLTDHSLVPMAARAQGMDFTQLVCRILDTTLEASDAAGRQHAQA